MSAWSKIKGLGFGAGLTWKVEEAYSYLMEIWEPSDEVFLFGFSRGSYTVRVLAGFLHTMGLLPRGAQNMVPYAMRLYKALRSERNKGDGTGNWAKLCSEFRWTFARPVSTACSDRRFPVHFLGVWDTVSSVGWVWDPQKFPFTAFNPSIRTVRHGISIDERRAYFRQNGIKPAAGQDVIEVWFPGVHCDVGGGYPHEESYLWRMPFEWILTEAQRVGLGVDPVRLGKVLSRIPTATPWLDCQHESLTPLWWIAELLPKQSYSFRLRCNVPRFNLGRRRYIPDGALIGNSALKRIGDRTINYLPSNLSNDFCTQVRSLSQLPSFLPFWRQETTQNFAYYLAARAQEMARPVIFNPVDQDALLSLITSVSGNVQKAGLLDPAKFSVAKDSVEKLVAEMRHIYEQDVYQQPAGALQIALKRLCPLWPFC
jgi:hypothetical protein